MIHKNIPLFLKKHWTFLKKHWTFSKILRDVFFKTTVCFFNGFGVSKTNVLMVFKWCFNTVKTVFKDLCIPLGRIPSVLGG